MNPENQTVQPDNSGGEPQQPQPNVVQPNTVQPETAQAAPVINPLPQASAVTSEPNPNFAQQFNNQPATAPGAGNDSANLDTWPGAFKIFHISKDAVRKNIWVVFVSMFVLGPINIVVSTVLGNQDPMVLKILGQILSFLISALASVGLALAFIAGVRGLNAGVTSTFKQGLTIAPKMVILQFLQMLIYVFSFLLLIVPFFFIAPRIALAEYYLVDKKLGPLQALKASWNGTKGHVGKLYGIVGVSILMLLPILTIIGILATVLLLFLYSAALVVLYQHILNKDEVLAPAIADPVTNPTPPAITPTV